MDITQVKIFPVQEDKLKAFVSVVFDQCFMINDIKVIQGKDGLFLSMPSRRKKSGEFKDVAHPLNNEMRRRLEESVLAEYRGLVDDPTPRRPDREDEMADHLAFPGDRPAPVRDFAAPSLASTPPVESPRAGASLAGPTTAAPVAIPTTGPASGLPAEAREVVQVQRAAAAAEPSPAEPSAASGDDGASQKTLEEVQRAHLRDSFWNVS